MGIEKLGSNLSKKENDFTLLWLSQLQLNDVMSLPHFVFVSYSLEIECMCAMYKVSPE